MSEAREHIVNVINNSEPTKVVETALLNSNDSKHGKLYELIKKSVENLLDETVDGIRYCEDTFSFDGSPSIVKKAIIKYQPTKLNSQMGHMKSTLWKVVPEGGIEVVITPLFSD